MFDRSHGRPLERSLADTERKRPSVGDHFTSFDRPIGMQDGHRGALTERYRRLVDSAGLRQRERSFDRRDRGSESPTGCPNSPRP